MLIKALAGGRVGDLGVGFSGHVGRTSAGPGLIFTEPGVQAAPASACLRRTDGVPGKALEALKHPFAEVDVLMSLVCWFYGGEFPC